MYLYFKLNSNYDHKYQKFLKSRVRLFGKIGCYLMSKKNSVEIDDKFDLKIARKL